MKLDFKWLYNVGITIKCFKIYTTLIKYISYQTLICLYNIIIYIIILKYVKTYLTTLKCNTIYINLYFNQEFKNGQDKVEVIIKLLKMIFDFVSKNTFLVIIIHFLTEFYINLFWLVFDDRRCSGYSITYDAIIQHDIIKITQVSILLLKLVTKKFSRIWGFKTITRKRLKFTHSYL